MHNSSQPGCTYYEVPYNEQLTVYSTLPLSGEFAQWKTDTKSLSLFDSDSQEFYYNLNP